jgi:hypothetical protein
MKEALEYWKNLGSLSKKLLQIRYFPATNWEYLSNEQIKQIFIKEKINK